VRATFTGFRALPAPKGQHWRDVLELSDGAIDRGTIEAANRRLAQKHHPDRGGSAEAMAELNIAKDRVARGWRRGVMPSVGNGILTCCVQQCRVCCIPSRPRPVSPKAASGGVSLCQYFWICP
jgi:hypothetical protein